MRKTATKTRLTPRLRYMAALKSYALKPTAAGGKKLMDAGYAIGKTKVVVQADLKKAVKSSARRPNPDPISTFANLAVGVASALQIHEHMKKTSRKKKPVRKAARRNPVAAKPAKAPVANHGGRKILDRKLGKGGNLYMLTIGSGDDLESIYLHDGKGNGFSRRFKTLTGARSHAKRHGYKLIENPAPIVKARIVKMLKAETSLPNPRKGAGVRIQRKVTRAANKKGLQRSVRQHRIAKAHEADVAKRRVNGFAPTTPAALAHYLHRVFPYGIHAMTGSEILKTVKKAPAWFTVTDLGEGYFLVKGKVDTRKNPLGIVSAAKRALARGKAKRELGRELRAEAKLQRIKARKRKAIAAATNPKPPYKFKEGDRVLVTSGPHKGERYTVSRMSHSLGKPHYTMREVVTTQGVRSAWQFPESGLRKVAAKKKNPTPARIPRRRTFESFNGRQATQVRQMNGSALAPQKLDQLGGLVEMKLSSGRVLKFNPSRVALAAAGGKLWIAGAKILKANPAQRTNEIVPVLDARNNPEHIEHVVYTTHKPHHGDAPGTHYIHKLGEDTGHRPTLCVDRDGYPVLRGGQYKIEARGIVN